MVLHYPSKGEFRREIQKRHYVIIDINFVVATFHKVQQMVDIIRKHSPGSKIVLGGYGTVLSDDELRPYSDFICREEGIGFHEIFFPAFIAPTGGTNVRICSRRSSRNLFCNLVRTQSATQSGSQTISR